jgi:hypothetical protein
MTKRVFRIREGEPLLDIVSYGSSAFHENSGRLSPEQVELVRRTVHRVPEVMVKVLPRASNDLKAAAKHVDYIGRYGKLPLETDDGDRTDRRCGKALLEDWDLDIDDVRRQAELAGTNGRKPPKLIHKLMFSMPPGTPPKKMEEAVRNFAREEFWGQHRYAFVLHTNEPHPHVHLVLKAISEQGRRLNIKKATLRDWRSEFARNLRALGVAANATDRGVRGVSGRAMKDAIYRAGLRGESIHVRGRGEQPMGEAGKEKLRESRKIVVRGWLSLASRLSDRRDLANDVSRFVNEMPGVRTDRERIIESLRGNSTLSRSLVRSGHDAYSCNMLNLP